MLAVVEGETTTMGIIERRLRCDRSARGSGS
jgi:hypothetical protein